MDALDHYEIWFVVGSQNLYGEHVLQQVQQNGETINSFLNDQTIIPVSIKFKGVVKNTNEITSICYSVNNHPNCIGLMVWMHTFSPAKMWINGLSQLNKPLLHLHTQFNSEIPWNKIDMDFMNLNQAAHGDREFGYMATRMGIARKVVVGHWKEEKVIKKIAGWSRAAAAKLDAGQLKVARLGDNMREVAVTEGNKVNAQVQFGYTVNGYGLGELQHFYQQISEEEINKTIQSYESSYDLAEPLRKDGHKRNSLIDAARIEVALRKFLAHGGFKAFTDTFEDLHGIPQLPGIAVQRLMAEGYGFGAEGDWKTAALLRAVKIMAIGLPGGTSFMEDYTYHMPTGKKGQVLGAHMLEICESIAEGKPSCEVHPLGIGGKEDPVRLVFNGAPGDGYNVSIIELKDGFRMIVNKVKAVSIPHEMPNLPVARVLWEPLPDFETALEGWILSGGAHHTVYTQAVDLDMLEDFALMNGVELVVIDEKTDLRQIKNQVRA